jgi:hypothetical protein
MKRIALVAVSLALVAGGAVGCGGGGGGGGSGTSKTASKDDFCGALESFQNDFQDVDPTKDLKGYVKKLKDAAKKLEDVGVPSNMPADAKDGFNITIDEINKIPDNASLDDLSKLSSDLSDADQKKVDALDSYISKECPGLDSGS